MQTIILTVGIPASGKTTWTIEEMKKHPNTYKRVNKDLMREMIDSGLHSEKNENFILKIRDNIVENALSKGYSVIVDDTNFGNKHWNSMCEIAKSIGDVQVVMKYFEISLKEAIERNSKRLNKVPETVICEMYNKHIKNKKLEIKSEYFPKNDKNLRNRDRILCKNDKPLGIIVDIDGTLALSKDRDIFDVSKVLNDDVYEDVNDLIFNLSKLNLYNIILVSGREDKCKQDTEMWLNFNNIKYKELFMRKTGDFRKDFIIKEEIYLNNIEPNYFIAYAIDDRPQVCKMWRKYNITTLQLNHIDF